MTRNYIVRVYRCEQDNPRSLVGMVEEPEKEGKCAFTCLDELWGILNAIEGRGMKTGAEEMPPGGDGLESRSVAGDGVLPGPWE